MLFEDRQPDSPAWTLVRRNLFVRLTALVIATMIAALAPPSFAQTPEYKKPQIHLKRVSVKRVDLDNRTAETVLLVAINNPGPAFRVKDVSYRVKLNDRQAAEGKYERDLSLPANSVETLELPCTVDLSALPGVAWGIIAGGFEVRYEMETEFTLPLFANLNPRLKTSTAGELSLSGTVSGWTAKIKEHLSRD